MPQHSRQCDITIIYIWQHQFYMSLCSYTLSTTDQHGSNSPRFLRTNRYQGMLKQLQFLVSQKTPTVAVSPYTWLKQNLKGKKGCLERCIKSQQQYRYLTISHKDILNNCQRVQYTCQHLEMLQSCVFSKHRQLNVDVSTGH